MVTYQTMTFGTKTTAPSIQQVSYQQYQQVAPSYQSYAYTPAQRHDIQYSLQTYQQYQTYNTTPQQRASTPTTPVPTVTTQKAGTPVIQGKNVSYQKVSDLGAIGDTKTIQMPDGSYRNYTRTGTNTYQYTEIRAADKATVTAKSDSTGAVQVTRVAPSASPLVRLYFMKSQINNRSPRPISLKLVMLHKFPSPMVDTSLISAYHPRKFNTRSTVKQGRLQHPGLQSMKNPQRLRLL